jgi:hypothetical protein
MIQGLNPGRGKAFFSSPKHPNQLWDPPSLLIGCWCSFLRVKWLESADQHTSPSSAEIKIE